MKILITGGLGFIGSNLAESFVDSGHNVTLLSRTDTKRANIKGIENRVNLLIKDVKEIDGEVEGMDQIFHLASTVDNYNIHNEPHKDVDVNCNGTLALLEACRHRNPGARILYTSTFFVNGNLSKLPATPDSPCHPLGLYPTTRLAGEHFCKIYNEVFEMDSVIARFTNVFGIKEQRDNNKKAAFNRMIGLAVDGKEINLYDNGIIKRDYIYVSDVVDACQILANKGERGNVYYVGRGEAVPLRRLVDMILEEAASGSVKVISPPNFHKVVGINDFYCDNTPLRDLGWEPKVSIREGIRRTINLYRKE